MIAFASSREEILEKLEKDIYAKNNIWDLRRVSIYIVYEFCRKMILISSNMKVQIYPIKCAFRKEL
jgi:hypothetical protein